MNLYRIQQYERALQVMTGRSDLAVLDEAKEILGVHTLVCK